MKPLGLGVLRDEGTGIVGIGGRGAVLTEIKDPGKSVRPLALLETQIQIPGEGSIG